MRLPARRDEASTRCSLDTPASSVSYDSHSPADGAGT